METNKASEIQLVGVTFVPGTPDPAPGVYPALWVGYAITSEAVPGTVFATEIGVRSMSGIPVEIIVDDEGLVSARHAAAE
jgi:hypothetical protein